MLAMLGGARLLMILLMKEHSSKVRLEKRT